MYMPKLHWYTSSNKTTAGSYFWMLYMIFKDISIGLIDFVCLTDIYESKTVGNL